MKIKTHCWFLHSSYLIWYQILCDPSLYSPKNTKNTKKKNFSSVMVAPSWEIHTQAGAFQATPVSLPSESLIQITIPVTTKLDCTNFLTWKSPIEPIVHAYGLFHHLDELVSSPTPTIEVNGIPQTNLVFLPWQRHDQFLLDWLRSSITGTVLSQHIACLTARDLWCSLHWVYSVVSKAKLMDPRRSLQMTTRGGSSCNDRLFWKDAGYSRPAGGNRLSNP